jgi:hypothetical protein
MTGIRQKGKIHQSEWDSIVSRHVGGESLASIARSYACTPPAIRYIVSRKKKVAAASDEHVAGSANAKLYADTGTETDRRTASASAASAGMMRRSRSGFVETSRASNGTGFDHQVRERVTSDISNFLVALDALWQADTPRHRELLLEATDRLLRAGARTRIELERLRSLLGENSFQD